MSGWLSLDGLVTNLNALTPDSVSNRFFRIHSGATDALVLRGRDGTLRSSAWHVHLGRDASSTFGSGPSQPDGPGQVQVKVEVDGAETPVVMAVGADNKVFFAGERDPQKPTEAELQSLKLKLGSNPVRFLVQQLNADSMRWDTKAEVSAMIFLWDSSDKIIVADVEGTVVKADLWSKSTDVMLMATNKHHEAAPGLETVRDGVGPLLSYFGRNGYRVLFLTASPITRADRVRDTVNWIRASEVQQWGRGAEVPASPVITTQDRMGTVLLRKLSDKLSRFSGQAKQSDVKASALEELLALFDLPNIPSSEEDGPKVAQSPFVGGLCESEFDARVYEAAGIPKDRILIVDKIGRVSSFCEKHSQWTWASYVEMYPALQQLFPKFVKSSTQEKQSAHMGSAATQKKS